MKHLPIMALILAMPVLLPAQSDPINNSPINNQTLFNLYEPVITPAALAGARSTCNVNSCLGPNLVPNPGFEQVTSCRSEEHTSELQSRGLISYAVFCLKKT